MEDIDDKFKETKFVVEANDFERQILWELYSENGPLIYSNYQIKKHKWVQDFSGSSFQIGSIKGHPIVMCVFWNIIDGVRVAFWNLCSNVTSHMMAEEWFDKHCNPKWDHGTRLARTNASNFHHCIHAIEEINAKSNS